VRRSITQEEDTLNDSETTLPKDLYSTTLRSMRANPAAVEKSSTIDMADFLGNAETWTVRTIRVDGNDIVFLQRINAHGGDRWVLPPEVTQAIARQRDGATTVNRKRGANKAAATRKVGK
jgi:hypothetical protein